MIYAGIGSRATPYIIQYDMYAIARFLAGKGFTLRSGGASGADQAFESGCDEDQGRKEIYLPNDPSNPKWWTSIAKAYHPAWDKCKPYARKLHARNTPIILGPVESIHNKVDFVLCWTPGAKIIGGTGQALRIAKAYNIPIFNMAEEDFTETFKNYLKERDVT